MEEPSLRGGWLAEEEQYFINTHYLCVTPCSFPSSLLQAQSRGVSRFCLSLEGLGSPPGALGSVLGPEVIPDPMPEPVRGFLGPRTLISVMPLSVVLNHVRNVISSLKNISAICYLVAFLF